MADTRLCPECGSELPSGAPEGLCPKCLLTVGLDDLGTDQVPAADAETIAPSESNSPGSPPGTKVHYFGDYELLDEIARGGMGVVYKARQVKLSRTVALKMILAGQLASEDDVKRFHAEAEAAANLQHANIVAIHEVGEHEGQHYFSMDYVDGPSLAEIVRQHPLGAKKAAEYVKNIAEAIHYAHGQGTLHRDLKPSNILIDQSDQPKITDFGLAKRIDGDSKLTASGAILGTPSYMPPEQAAAKRELLGPTSDVYSLGAVLYELLTGRPPFQAATPLDTLMQAVENEPPPPRLLNPDVPADLETICLKCLEKRPEQRYLTAQELADDLGRFLNHEPIEARPAGSMRKFWSWSKRRPWVLTGVASICVMALIAIVYWQWVIIDFQQYVMSHQDYVKEPGPRSDFVTVLESWNVIVLAAICIAMLGFNAQFRRRQLVGTRISNHSLAAYTAVAILSVGSVVYMLMKGIEAFVFEEKPILETLVWTYTLGGLGFVLAYRAIREIEWSTLGSSADADVIVSADLSEEQINQIDELLFADKKVRALIHYVEITGESEEDAKRAIDHYEIELFRKYPEKVPPDRSMIMLKGCLTLLFLILGTLFFFTMIVGTIPRDAYYIAGLISFSMSAGATATYRNNDRQFTRGMLPFLLLLLVGNGALAAVYSIVGILIGSLIGVVVGIGFGFVIPQLRFATHVQSRSVDWKARFVKSVLIASLTGCFLGLTIAVAFTLWGSSGSMNSDETGKLIFFFLTLPAVLASAFAVIAAVAVGGLRYFFWISGSD